MLTCNQHFRTPPPPCILITLPTPGVINVGVISEAHRKLFTDTKLKTTYMYLYFYGNFISTYQCLN